MTSDNQDMKSYRYPYFLFFWFPPCLIILFLSCTHSVDYTSVDGNVQGTTYHIVYQDPSLRNLSGMIQSVFLDVDTSLSLYNPSSLISRYNRNDSMVKPNKHLLTLIYRAMELHSMSNGLFDITVGPLVNAYGFGQTPPAAIDSKVIDSILVFTGLNKIRLNKGRLLKTDPRVQIDLNALAQGYTVDLISEAFDTAGIENYLIEVGGEVKTRGINPQGRPWRIGVDKPSESPQRQIQYIVHLENKALATSGNYRKFYYRNGVKYSHTINPLTGRPEINDLLSATVIDSSCTRADGLATCCMLMGYKKCRYLLDSLKCSAILIYASDSSLKTYISPDLQPLVQSADNMPDFQTSR